MIEKTTKMNMLYDFYHKLLTDKQKEYMEMYYYEDYSLGEIAEVSGVSRQAIYDTIKRTEQLLMNYEEQLSLYDKFIERRDLIERISVKVTGKKLQADVQPLLDALQKID